MPEAIKVLRKRFSGSFVDPMHKTPSEVGWHAMWPLVFVPHLRAA